MSQAARKIEFGACSARDIACGGVESRPAARIVLVDEPYAEYGRPAYSDWLSQVAAFFPGGQATMPHLAAEWRARYDEYFSPRQAAFAFQTDIDAQDAEALAEDAIQAEPEDYFASAMFDLDAEYALRFGGR